VKIGVGDGRWSSGNWAVVGLTFASVLLMLTGSLGPWVETPVLTVAGWSGWGFPLVIVGIAEIGLMIGFIAHRHRGWIMSVILLAIITLILGLLFWMLVAAASGTASLASRVFARGADQPAFEAGVSVGWGLILLVVASLACIGLGITAAIRCAPRVRAEAVAGDVLVVQAGEVARQEDDSLDW